MELFKYQKPLFRVNIRNIYAYVPSDRACPVNAYHDTWHHDTWHNDTFHNDTYQHGKKHNQTWRNNT